MENEIRNIMLIAAELSDLIRYNKITIDYNENLKKMNDDNKSQELLSRLISIGKELNEKSIRGETVQAKESIKNELVKKDLEKNDLVKSFIKSQKLYFDLIQKVIEKVNNPATENR